MVDLTGIETLRVVWCCIKDLGMIALIEEVITTRFTEGVFAAKCNKLWVTRHDVEQNSETLTSPNPENVGEATWMMAQSPSATASKAPGTVMSGIKTSSS